MLDALYSALDRWRRRNWRPGPELQRFATLRPLVVVTGGSEGIGRALAFEFARHGRGVLLVARTKRPLDETAIEIRARHGVEALIAVADLATLEGADEVERALQSSGAYADILVNAAGTGLSGPFAGQPPEELRRLADLNMRGLADLCRRFLPDMLIRGRGGILNVASLGGLVPGPHQAAYYASKAFVVSLTEALAQECRGMGVGISVLVPGPVATNFHARMGAERSYYLAILGVARPERVARNAYVGFVWGRTMIPGGVLDHAHAAALRLLPHTLSVPVIGWMLRRRDSGGG
jgi:hypothetical protein